MHIQHTGFKEKFFQTLSLALGASSFSPLMKAIARRLDRLYFLSTMNLLVAVLAQRANSNIQIIVEFHCVYSHNAHASNSAIMWVESKTELTNQVRFSTGVSFFCCVFQKNHYCCRKWRIFSSQSVKKNCKASRTHIQQKIKGKRRH